MNWYKKAQIQESPEIQEFEIRQFFINDYLATFVKMERIESIPNIFLGPNDVAVKAVIEIEGENGIYIAEPIYMIKDQMAGQIPFSIDDLAVRLTIESIHPETNSFSFGVQTTQKDWIIMEAVEKPLINILWLGTLLLTIGLVIAIYRRYDEFTRVRDKSPGSA